MKSLATKPELSFPDLPLITIPQHHSVPHPTLLHHLITRTLIINSNAGDQRRIVPNNVHQRGLRKPVELAPMFLGYKDRWLATVLDRHLNPPPCRPKSL